MTSFPDYYRLLNVSQTASTEEIRAAYKIQSLKTHPDRLANASQAEKKAATERFQAVADAYYVLSDTTRRREYDALYASRASQEKTPDPNASANWFSAFASMFGGGVPGAGTQSPAGASGERPDADHVFADVFDELLRPEVQRHAPWWKWLGAVSGAGLGFIVANVPGMMVGAYAGNRLGAIRDAKGKSVAAVFTQLGAGQKAEILRALAAKVLVYDTLNNSSWRKP
ncbi:DnaJ-domain-containing protein, partial [Wolfiporia cocos MD-104 SS10]